MAFYKIAIIISMLLKINVIYDKIMRKGNDK